MKPCTKCTTADSKVKPIITKYPCKIEADENVAIRPCSEINEEKHKTIDEKKETVPKKETPCEGVKISLRKKFEFLKRNNCQLPFLRAWDKNEQEISSKNELLPKWVRRRPRAPISLECPRELDDYERKLYRPICKPPVKPPVEVIFEPIDQAVCVFCLGSLYTGGYLHDLYEKIPYVKKQSEENNDDIIRRIGFRSRITVHKKCYNAYIDRSKAEGEAEVKEEEDESDSDICGESKEESDYEVADLVTVKEPNICLGKPKLPKVPSDLNFANKTKEMGKFKAHGLVADLWPNIRLLQLSGHFLHEYHEDNSSMNVLFRKIYSSFHLILILLQFASITANLAMESDDVNILAANSITVLFFTHCITKFCYFALRRQRFYRTLAVWDTQNSHPLFAESHSRHRALAIAKSRRLLMITVIGTLLTVIGWTGSTFFDESVKKIPDPENNNETITVEIPRLMLRAWYPWDATSGTYYIFSFVFQLYWLMFTLFHANLVDLLFCCWLIFACEQLLHVKEIMKPLIDLSSSLDTYNPGSADLFKTASTIDENVESMFDSKEDRQINIRGIYSSMRNYGLNRNNAAGTISTVNGIGPNGLTKKHEMLVRSAIKYWVERHKHIVRYVGAIGDAYGLALLLHMLTSTITLTLLAYQATQIDGMDLYAMAVLGYLFYSLAQVFAFCIYGNQLIEESSSVMEAAYSCQWYDGSEEAKTFVQIVCQQCQKALSISGAKFFTVSLDLFASVLGAVVTYFMVLVQLK